MGSIGDELMSPINTYILSGALNDYGSSHQSFANQIVHNYDFIQQLEWNICFHQYVQI
ncbi:hypothetical protein V6Z12_D02G211800 [Gossypium hirsutum]